MLRTPALVLLVLCLLTTACSDRATSEVGVSPTPTEVDQLFKCRGYLEPDAKVLLDSTRYCITQLRVMDIILVDLMPVDQADAYRLIDETGRWLQSQGLEACKLPFISYTIIERPDKIEPWRHALTGTIPRPSFCPASGPGGV